MGTALRAHAARSLSIPGRRSPALGARGLALPKTYVERLATAQNNICGKASAELPLRPVFPRIPIYFSWVGLALGYGVLWVSRVFPPNQIYYLANPLTMQLGLSARSEKCVGVYRHHVCRSWAKSYSWFTSVVARGSSSSPPPPRNLA